MIQRRQTLYLLVSMGFLISMFASVLAYNEIEHIKFTEIRPLLVLNIASALLVFISIFLYRHRILQMRVCVINTVILLGYQGWIAWLFFRWSENYTFKIGSVFPIICVILTVMSIRLIAVDEAIVRSTSRLRK